MFVVFFLLLIIMALKLFLLLLIKGRYVDLKFYRVERKFVL